MQPFNPTHVATDVPGFAHHVPCTPIPGLGELTAVDHRGPLLPVTTDGDDLFVFPARSVAPSVRTVVKKASDCDECAELLVDLLRGNNLSALSTYFHMTGESR